MGIVPRLITIVFAACILSNVEVESRQGATEYAIGVQDVLSIVVHDEAELGGKYVVEPDGSFSFPYVGRVRAAGLTVRAFEASLRARLADGYINDPQLTVSIEQFRSQRVFVIGEVRTPGAYPLTGDLTLIDAIASAGSTTPGAGDEALVVRNASAQEGAAGEASTERSTITIKLSDLHGAGGAARNIRLQHGDTVYVGKSAPVYIMGHVRTPGSYTLQGEMTVLQALSLAGGANPSGALTRVRVVRTVDGRKKEVRVSLDEIVQPRDTIIVPARIF